MNKIFLIVALCFSTCLFAQDWQKNYADALAVSNKTGKPIILVFAGSDWCTPCIKLEREIWTSSEFVKFAAQNYVLYKADFVRKKKNRLPKKTAMVNAALADNYNPKGYFPLVVVLDGSEKVLGKTGYHKCTPKEYITLLNAFVE